MRYADKGSCISHRNPYFASGQRFYLRAFTHSVDCSASLEIINDLLKLHFRVLCWASFLKSLFQRVYKQRTLITLLTTFKTRGFTCDPVKYVDHCTLRLFVGGSYYLILLLRL